jgi:hypothetical protein
MQKLMLLILTGMTACTPLHQIKSSQNNSTEITCSGIKSWQDCRDQAKRLCPEGYATSDVLENIAIQRRVMTITCNGTKN